MEALRVDAPAKLNLGLRVLGRRSDGYHDLDSLFVHLTLADTLAFELGERDELLREASGDAYLDAQPLDLGPANLVARALHAYREEAGGAVPPLRVTLTKRIPWGAGLAGGSADAAATLRALDRLFPAAVALPALAERLGSDVPFALSQLAAARVGGRGERVIAAEVAPRTVLLVHPGVPVATPDAFRWWGEAPPAEPAPGGALFNALEAGVARHVPAVAETLAALRGLRLGAVAMSGSGSTCYLLPEADADPEEVAARVAVVLPEAWRCSTRIAGISR